MEVIRVTDEQDGELLNRGYSYWPQCYVQGDEAVCFVGHADGRPRFFRVHLPTGYVTRLGSLLPYTGTGEGWYVDAEGGLSLCDGPRLRRVHPFSGADRIVVDISDRFPNCRLWQAHSSDDARTHNATVQLIMPDGPYLNVGTIVAREDRELLFYEARGTLDESQVTSDGRFLVIKENDDNRIIRLDDGDERLLTDADGAVGHSDVGPSFVVGEDNIHGECVRWDLDRPLTSEYRTHLFPTWNLGHVSVRNGRCLQSDPTHLNLVALDGAGVTPLLAHGMEAIDYDHQVHGNLSPCARVAAYVSDMAGRFDLYLLPLDPI